MTQVELNSILYYADYLSLQSTSHPVTDTCKYFFIHQHPINSAYIAGYEPEYNKDDKYFVEAYNTYNKIAKQFGEEGAGSFIEDICFLRACGMVDATRMLQHIHLYSSKYERSQAFLQYRKWKKDQIYTHNTFIEDGTPIERPCSKYVKHAETLLGRQKLHNSTGEDGENTGQNT